jgi:hypothetical protein
MRNRPIGDTMADGRPPRRRWFRFSLRFLAILVTVFTVWFGLTANRANRQRRAVEIIESHGGQFWYDYQTVTAADAPWGHRAIDPDRPPPGPELLRGFLHEHYFVTPTHLSIDDKRVIENGDLALLYDLAELEELTLTRLPLDDADVAQLPALKELRRLYIDASTRAADNRIEDFRFLQGFPRLEEFNVSFSKFSDNDVQYLRGARDLRRLWLASTRLGDDGLRRLERLNKIEALNLSNTRITDASLARLKSFPKLRFLSLNATAITDEGLTHLRSLPELTALDLINTPITDAGLEHLKVIRSLKRVEVIGSPITLEGVAEFLRARPTCRVRVNWDDR